MARIRKIVDLVGTRVGRLVVISQAPDRVRPRKDSLNSVRAYWNCLCDCGKSVEVRQDAILASKTNSCGCLRDEVAKEQIKLAQAAAYVRPVEDLTNLTFGRLTVLEPAPRSMTPKGRELSRWVCSCKCGSTIDVLHDSLKAGKTLTCGCVPPKFIDSEFTDKTQVFIFKAKEVHGGKYDYSLTKFTHSKDNLIVICPQHGAFEQNPGNHLMGSGCAKCSNVASSRNIFISVDSIGSCLKHGKYSISNGCLDCFQEDHDLRISNFVNKAQEVHGIKYDYSKVFFETNRDKVSITCSIHGEFTQRLTDHIKGQGCPDCGRLSKFIGTNAFIERSIDVHGVRFDYSLVDYKHSNSPVDIICKSHGIFQQKPSAHMNGQKCPRCSGEERALKQHWNYIKRCEFNPELAKSLGTLYLLKMTCGEEQFLKVGISSNFTKRVGRYREEGISFTTISTVVSTCLQVAIWEAEVLKYIRDNGLKYIPSVDFKGWTECAALEAEDCILGLFEEFK